MGDISEHFSKKDFSCKCKKCNNEFKMSLTLIGILELIRTNFKKRLEIVQGFICDEETVRIGGAKKNYHALGKAVAFYVAETPIEEVFLFAERIPQVQGLGLHKEKKFVYIDIRDKNNRKWIWENNNEVDLTTELRNKYNLGEPLPQLPA